MTDELVRYLAELSRLSLDDTEIEKLKKDMQEILDYMKLLDEIDVEGVEPMYTPIESPAPLREDNVEIFDNVEGIRENFPKERSKHVEVPGIHR